MSELFITVLNMSLTASYAAVAVIIIRVLLRRAPKVFSYALWGIVLFRLVCPISFESSLSLMPVKRNAIPLEIVSSREPAVGTGIGSVDSIVNQSIQSSLPPAKPAASVNPMGVVMEIAAVIWLLGIVALLCYSLVSYFRLKRRLSTATLLTTMFLKRTGFNPPFYWGLLSPESIFQQALPNRS